MSLLARYLFAMGVALILTMAAAPAPAPAQDSGDISQREDLVRQRDVLRLQERIRLRSTQGRWQEVIDTAEELLRLDPNNVTAILNKDRAEAKLASGEGAPGRGTEGPYVDPATVLATPTPAAADPLAAPPTADADPFAAPGDAAANPVASQPAEPQTQEEILALMMGPNFRENRKPRFNIYTYLTSLIGLVALVGLVGGGIAWMFGKEMSSAQVAAVAPSVGRSISLEDMPTVQGSHATAATAPRGGPTQPGNFEFGGKSTSETTMSGVPAAPPAAQANEVMYDAVTNVDAAPPPMPAYAPGAVQEETRPAPPIVEAPAPAEPLVTDPSARKSAESVNLGDLVLAPAESSGIGIDYSETDDPLFSASQALDVFPTQGSAFDSKPSAAPSAPKPAPTPRSSMAEVSDSLLLGPSPVAPPPAAKAEDSGLDATTGKQAFMPGIAPAAPDYSLADEKTSTDGFLDIAPPAKPPAPPPAAASSEEDDIAAGLTFNSLMFGSQPPATTPPATGGEDLSGTSFNQQYSNVMFGAGAEETAFSPAAPPPSTGGEEETLVFRNPSKAFAPAPPQDVVSADEVTSVDPPKPAAAAGPKISMFDRQRDAGKEAIAAEDYAKAVQCLSVAASLKPADKEVRELLEEARKKRRGV